MVLGACVSRPVILCSPLTVTCRDSAAGEANGLVMVRVRGAAREQRGGSACRAGTTCGGRPRRFLRHEAATAAAEGPKYRGCRGGKTPPRANRPSRLCSSRDELRPAEMFRMCCKMWRESNKTCRRSVAKDQRLAFQKAVWNFFPPQCRVQERVARDCFHTTLAP